MIVRLTLLRTDVPGCGPVARVGSPEIASRVMHVLPLRDDLFLLAHDDDGKLAIPEARIDAGLAGATLIDLLLSRRVLVADGRLDVIDPTLTGDGEADATIDAIAANNAPCGPRAWVGWISNGAYERVAAALGAAGVVRRSTTRRLGLLTVSRCVPCHIEDLVRVRSRLRYAIHGRDVPDPATAALCGLVLALHLESALLLNMDTSDLRLALERMTAPMQATVRQVTNAVEAVITTASHR
jgi:Golgi phosphoprotein 3 (GPP34)